MKAIHKTFGEVEVISQTNDKVLISYNGQEKNLLKLFCNLTDTAGNLLFEKFKAAPIEKKPLEVSSVNRAMSRGEKRRAKDAREIAKFDALPNRKKIEKKLSRVNGLQKGDRNSIGYQLWEEMNADIYLKAKEEGNTFIMNVSDSCRKYMSVSEKQGYVLSKFADESGIKYY